MTPENGNHIQALVESTGPAEKRRSIQRFSFLYCDLSQLVGYEKRICEDEDSETAKNREHGGQKTLA